jgi:hypothetical protein
MESTIVKSYIHSSNLRRWLRRPGCPEAIRELKRLFDKTFPPLFPAPETGGDRTRTDAAHYTVDGHFGKVNYSRRSTHVGNSVILYYPSPDSPYFVAGEIQKIDLVDGKPTFTVKRHSPLPENVYDPFRRYPHFPARCYSPNFTTHADTVKMQDVVAHGARFHFSHGRTVIVNLSRV